MIWRFSHQPAIFRSIFVVMFLIKPIHWIILIIFSLLFLLFWCRIEPEELSDSNCRKSCWSSTYITIQIITVDNLRLTTLSVRERNSDTAKLIGDGSSTGFNESLMKPFFKSHVLKLWRVSFSVIFLIKSWARPQRQRTEQRPAHGSPLTCSLVTHWP